MKIVNTQPRPHKLIFTEEDAKFLRQIYDLTINLESATMGIVPKEDILEQFIIACYEHENEETISIDLDGYYEEY